MFLLELAVVTSAIALLTVGVSIGFLYATRFYKSRRAAIIAPMIFAIAIGAAWLSDHTSAREWAYFTLPTLVLAPPWVSSYCYRKRLRDKGYYSGTV